MDLHRPFLFASDAIASTGHAPIGWQDGLVILAALVAAGVLVRGLLPRRTASGSGPCGCSGGGCSKRSFDGTPSEPVVVNIAPPSKEPGGIRPSP
jgi:hypothetical protein